MPKQAGKLRCHSSSGPKCSTKSTFPPHFWCLWSTRKQIQPGVFYSSRHTQGGTLIKHLWSQSLSASTKTKVTRFSKWNSDSLQLLNLENTVESRPAYFKVLSATPTFYLCSSFTRVMKKTVHSHMLLITSQLQGLHHIPTPENRKAGSHLRPTSPQLKSALKIMTQSTCSHCSTVRDCPTYCGKGIVRRTKANFHKILP